MRHFSHPHDLKLVHVPRENTESLCSGCEVYLFDACYTCETCNYVLHKSCFEFPQYTTHKSHPQHTLTLLCSPHSSGTCTSCSAPCKDFTYSCSSCQFNVHASCLRLDHAQGRDEYEQYFISSLRQVFAELKPFVEAQMAMAAQASGGGSAQQQMDIQSDNNELSRMRIQMMQNQIRRASESMDLMGTIGASGTYKYEYKY